MFDNWQEPKTKAGCTGKQSWPNGRDAMRAARQLSKRHGRMNSKEKLKPFRCECGQFHIGRDVRNVRAWERPQRFTEAPRKKG